MPKTITLPMCVIGSTRPVDLRLDVCTFARFVADPTKDLADAPSAWRYAGLIAYCKDTDAMQVTPRGEDLLASIDLIPDDAPAEPSKPKREPCPACDGKGERVLFMYPSTCDACEGTGHKPIACKAVDPWFAFPTIDSVSTFPVYRLSPTNAETELHHYLHDKRWQEIAAAGVEAEKRRILDRYYATLPDIPKWHTEGVPEVGCRITLRDSTPPEGHALRCYKVKFVSNGHKLVTLQDEYALTSVAFSFAQMESGWRYVDAPT